jgi:hypothetical protein
MTYIDRIEYEGNWAHVHYVTELGQESQRLLKVADALWLEDMNARFIDYRQVPGVTFFSVTRQREAEHPQRVKYEDVL